MTEDSMLERTNHINMLFDFYGSLLTGKQQSILALYYQDNYSLGEIAAELEVSRQAVYEHVKRAEQTLEDYESKLLLAHRYTRRMELAAQLEQLIKQQNGPMEQDMLRILAKLQTIEDEDAAE